MRAEAANGQAADVTAATPLFLGGPPKSGTTLLQALLDRHPELLVFPEEGRIEHILVRAIEKGESNRWDIDWAIRVGGGSSFEFGQVKWSSGSRDYRDIDFAKYTARARDLWNSSPRRLQDLLEIPIRVFGEMTGQENHRFWVDKTPGNEEILPGLEKLWPGLRFINIVRDPRDNFISYAEHRAKVKKDLGLTPARYVSRWCASQIRYLKYAVGRENCMMILYEDLARQPEAMMRMVAKFLGISWHETLLVPSKNGVPWEGNSMHDKQGFKGVSAGSLRVFETKLDPGTREILERCLGFALGRMGWEPTLADSCPPGFIQCVLLIKGKLHHRILAAARIRRLYKLLRALPGLPITRAPQGAV